MYFLIAACLAVQVDLESLVGQLDAPSWRAREAATMAIAQAYGELPVDVLQQRLAEGLLTPEQRTRIIMAVERRLIFLPRGALGVRMMQWVSHDDEAPKTGVRITEVVAGLPAHDVLKVADVITHMAGEPMRVPEDLVNVVQSRWPGDDIRMQAMRPEGGQWVEVDVVMALGSMDKLAGPGPPKRRKAGRDEVRFLEQLRQAHGPLVRTLARPVAPGRGSAAWIEGEVTRQRARLGAHSSASEVRVVVARWNVWLKAIDSKLGDRFLAPDRREALQQTRDVLVAAIEAFRTVDP